MRFCSMGSGAWRGAAQFRIPRRGRIENESHFQNARLFPHTPSPYNRFSPMATPDIAPPPSLTARRLLRGVAALLVLLLLLAAAMGAWFYHTASSALPQLDGTISMAGISAPA